MIAALVVLTVVVPLLNRVVPDGHVFHVSDYAVGLIGKILCFAICALAMDLIWGYTGILSLGHGLFFALGGYGMGMYLMRQIGRDGNYKSELPDFMVFLDWKSLPWTWSWSDSFVLQMLLVVLVPALLALVFGWFAFRSRIKGVYFSIITQALTYASMLLFFRNETGFGGNNGFTDFKRILGLPIATPDTRIVLFVITGVTLVGFYLLALAIVNSKYGRVLQAIRDAETRVMFTGYNPLAYKLSIWTLSAVMCAIAGALYVPQGREIFSRLTVEDNLRMGLAVKPGSSPIPAELFELFPVLKQMIKRRGGDLSGGQQQQLAIARALAAAPKLLILDEPTEGIQPSIIKDIGRVIRMLADSGLNGQRMAVVLVEQYYDFAAELADQYLVMERGEVIARGVGRDMQADGVRERVAI